MPSSLLEFLVRRDWPLTEPELLEWTAHVHGSKQHQVEAIAKLLAVRVLYKDSHGYIRPCGNEELVRLRLEAAGIEPDQEARFFFGTRPKLHVVTRGTRV
ncbi:MAG: hypothetical protein JST54_06905 [Deltaproteobacteria bacterium]|nr:hypothetical protein [Deltaproteobacteria bacterium]